MFAVISDRTNSVAKASPNNDEIGYYISDIVSATDYAPFGMTLVGRSFSSDKYRYGFNGKENDNEVKGTGNQQDYGLRIYDPRLGKFLSVDPLSWKYPMLTPYQFASNIPTKFVDLDGAEADPGEYMLIAEPPGTTNEELSRLRKKNIYAATATGVAKVVYYSLAAITQMAGASHYGDKIPKDKWSQSFPSIPNDNVLKDVIVPLFTAPIDIASQIKKDPLNFELWGQAAALFFMYKGNIPNTRLAKFKEGNGIIKSINTKNVSIRLAESAEETAFMQKMGQKASVRILENGEYDITFIPSEMNRISVMEEAIHFNQYQKYGEEYVSGHIFEMEIEAQNTLLRIGKKEGWSKSEMSEIKKAKATWENLANKEKNKR